MVLHRSEKGSLVTNFGGKIDFFWKNSLLGQKQVNSYSFFKMFLQYMCLGLENHKVCETHLNEQNFSKIKFFCAWNALLRTILRLKGATGCVFFKRFRPKIRKFSIFRPKFKSLKMMFKCLKLAQKHFFRTPLSVSAKLSILTFLETTLSPPNFLGIWS